MKAHDKFYMVESSTTHPTKLYIVEYFLDKWVDRSRKLAYVLRFNKFRVKNGKLSKKGFDTRSSVPEVLKLEPSRIFVSIEQAQNYVCNESLLICGHPGYHFTMKSPFVDVKYQEIGATRAVISAYIENLYQKMYDFATEHKLGFLMGRLKDWRQSYDSQVWRDLSIAIERLGSLESDIEGMKLIYFLD